jgi:hypothetical protein
MTSRFESKVVIGTAAETGIGAATARRFHAERAAVVMSGRRKAKLADVGRASARATEQLAGLTCISPINDCESRESVLQHKILEVCGPGYATSPGIRTGDRDRSKSSDIHEEVRFATDSVRTEVMRSGS